MLCCHHYSHHHYILYATIGKFIHNTVCGWKGISVIGVLSDVKQTLHNWPLDCDGFSETICHVPKGVLLKPF